MKPYFYKLKEKPTGRYYVGVQYGKKANPSNLWITYFSSNKYIKSQPKENFEILKIVVRSDARIYEQKYLRRCYSLLGKERFLKLMINRNLSPGILNTSETIEKANVKRRISNKIAAQRLLSEGKHNFQKKRYVPTPEQRKANSLRMRGNKLGSLRNITDEYRLKAAVKSAGNTNVQGKKWCAVWKKSKSF